MKRRSSALLLAAGFLLAPASGVSLRGADFINLGFNEPDLSNLPPPEPNGPALLGATADLLRGWTVTKDGVPLTQMSYRFPGAFSNDNYVTLRDVSPDTPPELGFGAYTLTLRTFRDPVSNEFGSDFRLRQTGEIPADAVGLRYFTTRSETQVLINGQFHSFAGDTAYPTLDISPYAGQTVTLEFRFPQRAGIGFDILGWTLVPEPSTWALLLAGGAVLGSRCRPRPAR